MAVLYKSSGEVKKVFPGAAKTKRGRGKFTLAELQGYVGGYIEAVPGTNARAYCNEEGRLHGLPPNLRASMRFNMVLVGDVIELETGDRQ